MKLSEIRDILKAEILCGEDKMDVVISGAGGADMMNDVLAAATKGAILLTGLTSEQVLRTAKIAQVEAVMFVRGKKPAPEIINRAKADGLPLLLTRHSLFVASGKLYINGMRGLDGSWS